MKNKKILLYQMIVVSILLCIPSILYLLVNKTVDGFDSYYTYSLVKTGNLPIGIINGIIVIGLLLLFSMLYIFMVKEEKNIFKNRKQILVFITIISFIFMLILPYLSSDIYYYIGDSWLCSKYHENPYYTSVKDLQDSGINDEILNNTGYWKNTVSVYGPLYNLLSALLSFLSFGKITDALYIFKVASLFIHILNCYYIYKLTKSKKYMLLYGLNPLILLELLSNVHNDIYLILFLILTLYALIKKKNIYLTIICLALSIAIKYSTVLIVPFILIYYFRKEKTFKRIFLSIASGLAILAIVIALYAPYYRDITIFTNMLVQGERYSQSIISAILVKIDKPIFNLIKTIRMPVFAIVYIASVVRFLLMKKITIKKILKDYNILNMIFIFFVLTNFQKWYILWLFPTIIWQSKIMRDYIISLTVTGIIPSFSYFIIENDSFSQGMYYSLKTIILAVMCILFWRIIEKGEANGKINFNRWK